MAEGFMSINIPWTVVLAQTILCILLVLYCIIVTKFNISSLNVSPKQNNQSPQSTDTTKGISNNIIKNELDSTDKLSSTTSSNDQQQINQNNQSENELKKRSQKVLPYRIQEERTKKTSSEYTRRGMLWSRHASWHLPSAPRPEITQIDHQGLEHILSILKKYDVDPIRGFLPSQDPLQRLPYARYHLWEDLGDDLPKLLGARLGQARDPLRQLPVLMTDKLTTDDELRRAHLLLCLFAHAYIWGGPTPMDHIPEGIARPLYEVSQRLDIPPVLGHPSIVLYNWRRLDIEADLGMENLTTLNNFFDGRDESWFYLITVEVEARGAAAVLPMLLAMDAVNRYNEEKELIQQATAAIAVAINNQLLFTQQQQRQEPLSLQQQQQLLKQQSLLNQNQQQPQQQPLYNGIPLTMMRNRPLSRSSSSNAGGGNVSAALTRGTGLSGTSGSSGGGFLSQMNTLLQPQQHGNVDDVVDGDKVSLSTTQQQRQLSSLYHENFDTNANITTAAVSRSIDSEYRRCLWGSGEDRDNDNNNNDDYDDDDESRFNRALIGGLTIKRVVLYVTHQLLKIAIAIKGMCLSIDSMREGCHPFIFYHRVRPFLSGWKDNPILPDGVIYEGVNNNERMKFYGGSAAQSALLPFLDITLGVSHAHIESSEFLLAMRDYMNKGHREFLIYLESISCLRQFVADHIQQNSINDINNDINSNSSNSNSAADQSPLQTHTQNHIVSNEMKTNLDKANNSISNSNNSNNSSSLEKKPSLGVLPPIRENISSSNLTADYDDDNKPKLFSPIDSINTNNNNNYSNNIHTAPSLLSPLNALSSSLPLPLTEPHSPPLEKYIWKELREAYNDCISNLQRFRSAHINLVAEYIIAQQRQQQSVCAATSGKSNETTTPIDSINTKNNSTTPATTTTDNNKNNDTNKPLITSTSTSNSNPTTATTVSSTALSNSAGGKGTGGTDLMQFLKPIRDNVKHSMFKEEEDEKEVVNEGSDAKEKAGEQLKQPQQPQHVIKNEINNKPSTIDTSTDSQPAHSHSTSLTHAGRSMSAQSHYRSLMSSRLPPLPPTPFELLSSPLPTTDTTQTSYTSDTIAGTSSSSNTDTTDSTTYHKDNAGIEDIDLYRSTSSISRSNSNNSYNPISSRSSRSMSLPVTFAPITATAKAKQ